MTTLINPVYLWLILGLLLLLVELLTPGFVIACFGIGALLAMIPAALGGSIVWQVIVFCAGALLSLFLLRPFMLRMERRRPASPTGVEALYGREARVTECIDAAKQTGRVSVDGDNWRARAADPAMVIPRGASVRIVGNESIVMIVEPAGSI